MVGERDPKFFSELKQMNDDLLSFLRTTHEKSPYFDFTPTVNDYVRQMNDLDKQYPEKSSTLLASPADKVTSNAIMTTSTFATPFTPTASLFAPTAIVSSPPNPLTASSITQSSSTISQAPPTFLFGSPKNPIPASTSSIPPFSFSLPLKKDDNTVTNNTSATDIGLNNDKDGDKNDEDALPPEPKIDKYEEPDSNYSAKCKLYEKSKSDGEVNVNLLGVGYLYVKTLDVSNKLQVIFRLEPDYMRVLLNELVTPNIPVKLLPKAVQLVFPSRSGETKFYIIKVRDEAEANKLYEMLNLSKV